VLLIPPDLDRRTGPARGTAILGILLGALAPGILLWLAIAAIGRLLTGPLIGWNRSESALNRSLQDTRDRTWDSVTELWSHVGNTEIVIGVCLVVVALVSWRTRRWWFAVIPAIAVRLQREQFGRGDGRDRSPAPGRSTSGPRATDVELSKWLSRRQRRALRPPRHHGHGHQADLVAPHRDWRVFGHPGTGGVCASLPRHAPSQ